MHYRKNKVLSPINIVLKINSIVRVGIGCAVKLRKISHANPLTPDAGEPLPSNTKCSHHTKLFFLLRRILFTFNEKE